MIKRVVHIDQNFPRRFSEQSDVQGPSKTNWGFNTSASTFDGSVDYEPVNAGKLTQNDVNQSTYVDALYDNVQLTQQQLDNLVDSSSDGKQIRFNANVFNYIVHTEIDNIILKYDAPVVYTEGVENKYTGEFAWKEKYIVLGDKTYHISFDILLHDPIGIDKYCYEAWVRGTKFGHVDRKNDDPADTRPHEQCYCAKFLSETEAETVPGAWPGYEPSFSKYITLHSTSGFSINKLADPFKDGDDVETAFKISVQLGGVGYDDAYINTDPVKYQQWKTLIESDTATEDDIRTAWEACEGVKFKFFDVAGNITYWVMPHIKIEIMTLEELYTAIKQLSLEFINTQPENLQLGNDLIGRTTIKVTNSNSKLSDCNIVITLDETSIGTLYTTTRKETYITTQGQHVAKIVTEDVGNIDESGWVHAHAVIDIDEFAGIDELERVRTMIKNLTRVDGSLGEWIKECNDNDRKITLDPFVPQYLKETTNKNSAYYKFVKFTENYLNTMFKAYDKNCYISVLEAIARIGNFNDYNTIYKNLLDKYDNDHGDMLHITSDELALLIDTDRQEPTKDAT